MIRDCLKLPQSLSRNAHDGIRHCRGEHENATFGVRGFKDRIDFIGKTHVEHLISLVENEELDVREAKASALDHVQDAARRSDHHIRAALQGPELQADCLASIDGHNARKCPMPQGHDLRVHLDGKLPCRDDNKGANVSRWFAQKLHQRQPEGRGLAGAGARTGHKVSLSRHEKRNGQRLDGSGFFEPLLLEERECLLTQSKGLEIRCYHFYPRATCWETAMRGDAGRDLQSRAMMREYYHGKGCRVIGQARPCQAHAAREG